MGNQEGKQSMDVVDTNEEYKRKTDPYEEKLIHGFMKYADQNKSGMEVEQLDYTHFEKAFHRTPTLGKKIYDKFVQSQQDNSQGKVTKKQFINFGLHIVHMIDYRERIDFFISLFSSEKSMVATEDFIALLETCFTIEMLHYSPDASLHENLKKSLQKSMFGSQQEVDKSDLVAWTNRNLPRLLETIHSYSYSCLCGTLKELPFDGAVADTPIQGHILSMSVLWALYCYLPKLYTLNVDSSCLTDAVPSNISLVDIIGSDGWQLLYDSNQQGLSMNRFQHHVLCYKGPTLTMIQFKGHLYCLGADKEWSDMGTRWGESDCFLLQIYPHFKLMQAGTGMLYLNTLDRKYPKGLHIGKDSRTTILQIDEEFATVKHYGMDVQLEAVEVWGCSDKATFDAQRNQRSWEHKEAMKNKDRKLKLEDWKDNPDRQILEYGGITTEHAER